MVVQRLVLTWVQSKGDYGMFSVVALTTYCKTDMILTSFRPESH